MATVRTEHFLLLEDDWAIESPRPVRFTREATANLNSDARIGQIKLDALHFTDFADRQTYDGPFRIGGGVPFYVQNPRMMWGGYC